MIGANQLGCLARRFRAETLPAMAAHIVKGARLTVLPAHHDQGVVAKLKCDIGAGLWQLGLGGSEDPARIPNPLKISTIDSRIRVEGARQRSRRFLITKQR
jgi:hypothetical protein